MNLGMLFSYFIYSSAADAAGSCAAGAASGSGGTAPSSSYQLTWRGEDEKCNIEVQQLRREPHFSYLSDDVEEVWRGGDCAQFVLDVLHEPLGEDLEHGLGGQLVHGVVLVVAAGQIGELLPRQLVDTLDAATQVRLEETETKYTVYVCK